MDHHDDGARPGRQISDQAFARLSAVSTATLTTQLLRLGFRNTFMSGVQPLCAGPHMVGYARTLRYIPAREDLDLHSEIDNRTNVQRVAVETIGMRDVLVIDARGEIGAASLGHILATRLQQRGAAGLVTDGALRDTPSIVAMDFPVYARAAHARMSFLLHHPVDMDVPIGCGGVMVQPGDVVVGDAEGVVVIPIAVAEDVAHTGWAQEQLESFLLFRIRYGASLIGVYPPEEDTLHAYEQWQAEQARSNRNRTDG